MGVLNLSSCSTSIRHFFSCMGNCFGCCWKPTPVIAVDEPTKGLKIQGRPVKKPGESDGFWSSSTCDFENATVQSQRSISSINVPSQNISSISGAGINADFVNHGSALWQKTRLQWVGDGVSRNRTRQKWSQRLSWNMTYESLLGSRNPFPRPIPLSEMVDFLVEVWEHEGLYE